MGLGSTAKKLQTISESAEKMYRQVQELQGRIVSLEEEVDETHETVNTLDHRVAEQRALVEAIAEAQGVDVDEVLAEAAIEEAEADENAETDGEPDEPAETAETDADAADPTAEPRE